MASSRLLPTVSGVHHRACTKPWRVGRLQIVPREVSCKALSSDSQQRVSQAAAAFVLSLSGLVLLPDGAVAQAGAENGFQSSLPPVTALTSQLAAEQDQCVLCTAPALCDSPTAADATRVAESPHLGLWLGWEERVAADDEFAFKVLVELAIGVTATVLGDMSTRPNWGLRELDFVFATLVVGILINLSLVWLLAPTVALGTGEEAASADTLQQIFSDHYLVEWGAPGAHMFQPGFSLDKRLVNFAYKGSIFAGVGLASGVVGTMLSNGLIALRRRLDPDFKPQNLPPSVLGNAASWGIHMAISANLRYQIINGLDMLLQPLLPAPLFRLYSFLLRSGNNVLGGMSFVLVARLLGVQKVPEPPAPKPGMPVSIGVSTGNMRGPQQKKRQ